jgi:hypothetical protein
MYLKKNESTVGGRGWHYLTRLSQIEEKFKRAGEQEKFGQQRAHALPLFANRQEHAHRHCLRCGGRVGVRWPYL